MQPSLPEQQQQASSVPAMMNDPTSADGMDEEPSSHVDIMAPFLDLEEAVGTAEEGEEDVMDVDSIDVDDLPESGDSLNTKNSESISPQALDLCWSNVNMTVVPPLHRRTLLSTCTNPPSTEASTTNNHNHNNKPKKILTNVSGSMPRNQVTAIMGPSGAGKTSLLHILSGRIRSNKQCQVEANLSLRGQPIDLSKATACAKYRQSVAFVAQEDMLHGTSTPRECIRFSAQLRLPKRVTNEQLESIVADMIQELGLEACADTILGHISGGERKRTSVAVEMVTRPSLVFLDEATSGLDSSSALQLCQVLQSRVAHNHHKGTSVLLTIHQPSSELLTTLDHILLMHQGRILYRGGVEAIAPYFASRGFVMPPNYNPTDWMIHVAVTNPISKLEQQGFLEDNHEEKDKGEEQEAKENTNDSKNDVATSQNPLSNSTANDSVGFWVQTRLLWNREVTNLLRNQQAMAARLVLTLLISGGIGAIFFQVATLSFENYVHVQSTISALVLAMTATIISTSLPSLLSIPQERPVFLREYSTNHYSVGAYMCSRILMETLLTGLQVILSCVLIYFCVGFSGNFAIFFAYMYLFSMTSTALGVMVGCATADAQVAIELMPIILMPQILFCGFFSPPELMPAVLAWIQYICPMTYALRIGLINEFGNGRCDDMLMPFCGMVLTNTESEREDIWWYWLVSAALFVMARLLALVILHRKATRFN